MRFKHVMSCIKIDTLGLKGVHVSITNCAYAYCSYLPCICHGSADDPKENATGPFSTFVFDAV
ncbi:hypothetical protein T01_6929 [Trichinella spiralis]|uniref:Uncharacterized protein n=1 Tax=Trichinella spiralis TaxID=6334 RepID=A0A0V1BJN9_TRISP|nr:hypothetical protein T01_6929 [Trichinella spiralis]